MPGITTLIVEDFPDFRRFVASALQQRTEFQVIHEASNGLEGVQRAEELQPDLILLDIGLPGLNGIEAVRRIREVSPNSKIIFLTQESSPEIVQEALSLGAPGYVLKSNMEGELFLAIESVFRGEQFVSRKPISDGRADAHRRHEILFCSNDEIALDALAGCIATSLKTGNAAIVWATESHRQELVQRLYAHNIDVDAAIQRGIYMAADISEPPDPTRIQQAINNLIKAASDLGNRHPRITLCGERAGRLWAEGQMDVAIRIEQLFNKLAKNHDVEILCVYPLPYSQEDNPMLKRLCEEHTAVHSR